MVTPSGCFQKMGVGPENGCFIMENPIKMGWFGGTPIFGNTHLLPNRLQLGVQVAPEGMMSPSWQAEMTSVSSIKQKYLKTSMDPIAESNESNAQLNFGENVLVELLWRPPWDSWWMLPPHWCHRVNHRKWRFHNPNPRERCDFQSCRFSTHW